MFEHLRDENGQIPYIRAFGKGRSEQELRDAEASYLRYLTLLWRIGLKAGMSREIREEPKDQV